jgi:hypothetical protein
MTKRKPDISRPDVLSSFFEQLAQVGGNQRGLVILTHGFIELLTNTVISARCKHGGLLTPLPTQLPGGLQFAIPLGKNLLLLPFQLILGGHIPKERGRSC